MDASPFFDPSTLIDLSPIGEGRDIAVGGAEAGRRVGEISSELAVVVRGGIDSASAPRERVLEGDLSSLNEPGFDRELERSRDARSGGGDER